MLTLSIITVSRNRCALLLEKIKTLSQQTLDFSYFELVLCLNGTEDDSLVRVQALDVPFTLKLIIHDKNEAIGAARNACVQAAQGHYIYFSDDDVWLEPSTLQQHLTFHQQHDANAVAVGHICWHNLQTGAISVTQPASVNYWQMYGISTSMAKALFLQAGGFVDWLVGYGHEDVLLGYMLQQQGAGFHSLASKVHHQGIDPTRGDNLSKPYQAGRNAVRIVQRYPQLAFRLGVHPLSLLLKALAMLPPLAWLWSDKASFAYEKAYLQGALRQRYHADDGV